MEGHVLQTVLQAEFSPGAANVEDIKEDTSVEDGKGLPARYSNRLSQRREIVKDKDQTEDFRERVLLGIQPILVLQNSQQTGDTSASPRVPT